MLLSRDWGEQEQKLKSSKCTKACQYSATWNPFVNKATIGQKLNKIHCNPLTSWSFTAPVLYWHNNEVPGLPVYLMISWLDIFCQNQSWSRDPDILIFDWFYSKYSATWNPFVNKATIGQKLNKIHCNPLTSWSFRAPALYLHNNEVPGLPVYLMISWLDIFCQNQSWSRDPDILIFDWFYWFYKQSELERLWIYLIGFYQITTKKRNKEAANYSRTHKKIWQYQMLNAQIWTRQSTNAKSNVKRLKSNHQPSNLMIRNYVWKVWAISYKFRIHLSSIGLCFESSF